MTGGTLTESGAHFGIFLAIVATISLTMGTFIRLLVYLTPNPVITQALTGKFTGSSGNQSSPVMVCGPNSPTVHVPPPSLAGLCLLFLLLFSGFIVPQSLTPAYWKWVMYVNPFYYSFQSKYGTSLLPLVVSSGPNQ